MRRRILAAAILLLAGLTACAPGGNRLASTAPQAPGGASYGGSAREGDRFFEPGFIPGVTPRFGPMGGPVD